MKSKTRIESQSKRKGNEVLVDTIRAAKKTDSKFWIGVASVLSAPRRSKVAVNLSELDADTKEGDTIVVPGKVLSRGDVSKKIAIVAFDFSDEAKSKLLKTKSQVLSIADEIKKNPEAKGLRMFSK